MTNYKGDTRNSRFGFGTMSNPGQKWITAANGETILNSGYNPSDTQGQNTGLDWNKGIDTATGLANAIIGWKGMETQKKMVDQAGQALAFNKLKARGDEAKQVSLANNEMDRRAGINAQRQGLAGQAQTDFMNAEKAKHLTTVL